jgi:ketosteroid isomerase-like protein
MPDTIIAQILELERRWVEIYGRNDADAFAGLLTHDFVYTSPTGEVVPRKSYLDNLRDRVVVMTSVIPTDEEVRVHGDAAVVTASWTVDEAYRGTPYKGAVRVTRTWVREEGEWRALAFQVTNQRTPS